MSLAHVSCVIICLLFEWKFTAAIACFSVQKEVSMPHLRRYKEGTKEWRRTNQIVDPAVEEYGAQNETQKEAVEKIVPEQTQ